ncbi:sodium/hydrogen exchanger 3 isoform X2 [Aplysia californica]|uniref:Sodium/hydrogen exchanger n=1 Tax=Aplysia californica TaxID=6500 RepID=A0ABM0JTE1_APLCA|nr:sodium/hydrogen exchanger 3 isoform X2 [Aplysia californica]
MDGAKPPLMEEYPGKMTSSAYYLPFSQCGSARRGFHLYDKLPHIFPESCLLITLGILVGVTLYYTGTADSEQYSLDANTFFLFLLPPIIYDAGYHMPNRAFFNNLGTILLLAVVNTLWNTLGIGLGLWGMSYIGWIHQHVSILHCFVFSALISAVDPVAVLAIFEEIQVNEILYIIVFGESLLNDGVTVVIYHMMEGFTEIGESNLQAVDFLMGFAQFFVVVLGGTLIGVVYGLVGAFITKYTDHVRVLEPLFIFVLGYLAYLTAESLELSGILALTFGGIVMRHYTEANMAKKSTTTVKYFMKMLANISETVIFMFLGLSVVIENHEWHLDFILFTVLFCLIFRVTGVIFLSFMVNRRRLIRLTAIDQFIMSYGGLRGGIAFCLALLLQQEHIPEKAMFVSTTVVMVFFTVFIQGITIKPVVNALKVEKAEEKDPSMNEMIHKRFIDHLMAGVEDIVGKSGHNSIQHKFEYYNNKYLKPWLLREKPKTRDTSILRVFTKLNLQDAKAAAKTFPSTMSRDPSFSQLMTPSLSRASLYSRRATIAVPNDRDHETVVNMHMVDPTSVKQSPEDEAIQQVLEESMYPPRSTWVRERRHTLAEVHNHPPFHHDEREQLRHFIRDLHGNSVEGVANGNLHPHMGASRAPVLNGHVVKKNVSFSGAHTRLSKQLSDVAEILPGGVQENSCYIEDSSSAPRVVFTVGKPPPMSDGVQSDPDSQSPISKSPPSDPAPASGGDSSEPVPPSASEQTQSVEPSADTNTTVETSSGPSTAQPAPTSDTLYSRPPDIPLSHTKISASIPIPATSKHSRPRKEAEQSSSSPDAKGDEDKKSDSDKGETSPKEETVAESSLPWRRQTSLPPVPSSVSLSLPDDENPLMSEAPSWADNLAYNNLTETGSPYHSPQNTITAVRAEENPRPVFDIFPASSPSPDDKHEPMLPLPWSFKDNEPAQGAEALPSHSVAAGEAGDKASCFLVSPHDLAPPAYHCPLQPQLHSVNGGTSRRALQPNSPIHFQQMEKPDSITAGAIESQLIGIETDYHHGMTDRVSQWLASASNSQPDEDPYHAQEQDREMILESLRQKKERNFGDTDEGTDADVESDCEVRDTRL